ncbi:protoporphyrinogen oxidase HemJ [Candidatus Pelagibacter sp.]|nr:protoporphyrinogen oxidase HemJ [Candidatus Pelagibacter sp.]
MNTYLLFKSLHLIAVVSWMAGLLYLPRIFVYHAENNSDLKISEIFKTMEKKLFFYIMTPAMTLSWLFGLLLIHSIGFQQLGQAWMLLKILFVIILTIYHFYLGKLLGQFKIDSNRHSHRFYRYINEIPTILLILIIFVVIFKPIWG